jgi:hypothetical protein
VTLKVGSLKTGNKAVLSVSRSNNTFPGGLEKNHIVVKEL